MALLMVLVAAFGGSLGTDLEPASGNATDYRGITQREYALIVKDPDAHEGEGLIVYGVVEQADSATGRFELRLDTSAVAQRDAYDYEHNTLVSTTDDDMFADVVQGDLVTLHAEVVGTYTYETTLGGEMTVPHLNVGIIEVTGSS